MYLKISRTHNYSTNTYFSICVYMSDNILILCKYVINNLRTLVYPRNFLMLGLCMTLGLAKTRRLQSGNFQF